MKLTAAFNVRGGIYTHVAAEHRANNWAPKHPLPAAAWHADPTAEGETP
jgi:7-cyano-7-deazaguanine reductase